MTNTNTFCLISISNLKTGRFETRRFVNLTFCKPDVLKPDVLKPDVLKPDVLKPDVLWVYRKMYMYANWHVLQGLTAVQWLADSTEVGWQQLIASSTGIGSSVVVDRHYRGWQSAVVGRQYKD
jgi:hypothetical protein